jgi:hypothetical protein
MCVGSLSRLHSPGHLSSISTNNLPRTQRARIQVKSGGSGERQMGGMRECPKIGHKLKQNSCNGRNRFSMCITW